MLDQDLYCTWFVCKFCKFALSTEKETFDHYYENHSNEIIERKTKAEAVTSPNSRRLYYGNNEGKTNSNQKKNVPTAAASSGPGRKAKNCKYNCNLPDCKYKSNNKSQFGKHMRETHHSSLPTEQKFKCNFKNCEFVTGLRSNFRVHMDKHTRDDSAYPYECKICHCKFKQIFHVTKHASFLHPEQYKQMQ